MANTTSKKPGKVAKKTAAKPRQTTPNPPSGKVVLLSGGNPQIAKGYGDAPVQAYIAAMPGWKRSVGRRLDALVTTAVPGGMGRKEVPRKKVTLMYLVKQWRARNQPSSSFPAP